MVRSKQTLKKKEEWLKVDALQSSGLGCTNRHRATFFLGVLADVK